MTKRQADSYVHGHAPPVVAAHGRRTAEDCAGYLLEVVEPGDRILDVGCGPGSISIGLARAVGDGHVIGMEVAAEVLVDARALAQGEGVANVEFVEGSVYELDFDDHSFDAVHAHQVLQHLSDPVAALVEMARVVRPGGWIAVRDADYRAMFHHPETPALLRWHEIYDAIARSTGGEPDAGRLLPGWFGEAGLSDLSVSGALWTFATHEGRTSWGDSWAQRVLESNFAEVALKAGFSTHDELEGIAEGWRRWARTEGATFAVPHVQVLARRNRS